MFARCVCAGLEYFARFRFRVRKEIVNNLKFIQWVYKLKLPGGPQFVSVALILLLGEVWMAETVHALEGLACRKCVAPASSPAAPASRVWRSRRLRSTLAAAPGLLAHALVTKQ